MRKLITLIEEAQKAFYHGSWQELPVGTILRPRDDYESDWSMDGFGDTYKTLEKYRPPEMLAHKDAVFMCDNPDDIDNAGGSTDYLFTVVPLGKIERHDLNWGSEINMLISENESIEKIQIAAENYWNGVPHHDENVWEYLTPSAKIIAVEEY